MPRYFLNLRNGVIAVDHEGIELADLTAARTEAIGGLRDIVAQEVKNGRVPTDDHIDITDEAGTLLATVSFKEAIEIMRGRKPGS